MKSLFAVACSAILSAAGAQGIISTQASFLSSRFCALYTCEYISRDTLSKNLFEYRYSVRKLGSLTGEGITTISVLRTGMTVSSIGFAMGIQDSPFSTMNSDPLTLKIGRLFEQATGLKISNASLVKVYEECEKNTPKEIVKVFKNGSRTFSLVCSVLSDESIGANRFYFRVY